MQNDDDPARISYRVKDAKDLAWVLFHEGFRCGYGARTHGETQVPRRLEPYILELYKMISAEIRDQNPQEPNARDMIK